MCGRFTLRTNSASLVEHFGCELPFELPLRYNIAPTQPVATVRIGPDQGARQWQMVRWGLIPSWAKDASIGSRMINARAETVADKPAFRTALRRRRCLVPADGYFEWQKTGTGKQPFYIRLRDDLPFAMAGLWERWISPETGEPIETCTIITTDANELTRPIHDRMPVILNAAEYDLWLDPQVQDPNPLRQLLRPFDVQAMRADPVDTCVNSPRNDDPWCIPDRRFGEDDMNAIKKRRLTKYGKLKEPRPSRARRPVQPSNGPPEKPPGETRSADRLLPP